MISQGDVTPAVIDRSEWGLQQLLRLAYQIEREVCLARHGPQPSEIAIASEIAKLKLSRHRPRASAMITYITLAWLQNATTSAPASPQSNRPLGHPQLLARHGREDRGRDG